MSEEPAYKDRKDPDVVPRSVFTVDALPEQQRYTEWKESIACIFQVDAERSVRHQEFNATVDSHLLDGLFLGETSTRAQKWERSALDIASDGMDHFMIQLFSEGSMSFEEKGLTHELPNGGLVLFDLAKEAKTDTGDFTNLSIIVRRDLIEPFLHRSEDKAVRFLSPKEPMVELLYNHMKTLKSVAPRMSHQQAQDLVPHTVGLAVACLNGTIDGSPTSAQGVPLVQISATKRIIEEELHNPNLTPEEIARKAGLSRTKLYEIFEPFGGVANYIRERRLRRVLNHLTSRHHQHRPVYDIALANGFENASSFSRLFKKRFGHSPKELQKNPVLSRQMGRVDEDNSASYERWLHTL